MNYESKHLIGETDWFKSLLKNKNEPVIIDVGANEGEYSKQILDINPGAKILAFEPHPGTYKRLTENIKSPNLRAFNYAVGAANSSITLYDYDDKNGSVHASVYEGVIDEIHNGSSKSCEVQMIKLSELLSSEGINNIDLLKIDVEGNEYNVLKGVNEYIKDRRIEVIQFEFNEMNIYSRSNFKDFWEILGNYNLYRILPGGELLDIKKYIPLHCEIYAFQNIVAILKNE